MDKKIIYSKEILDFAKIAVEYCKLAENPSQYSKADFLKVASQLLPMLYIKTSLLPKVEPILDEELEEGVDEYLYEHIRNGIRERLTSHDDYLEVFKDDFKYSETPVVASISEDMADIYQDVRNFCESYKLGVDEIMNDAIARAIDTFKTYWGQRLCNTMRAIHSALYSGDDLSDERPASNSADEEQEASKGGNLYDTFITHQIGLPDAGAVRLKKTNNKK